MTFLSSTRELVSICRGRGRILLFFGGLRRDKGPDLFLRALALVSRGLDGGGIAGEPLSSPPRGTRARAVRFRVRPT